jgi:hypothetical protein
MKVANVDFTGIAILLGGAIALYAGYRLYKGSTQVIKDVSDKVKTIGTEASAIVSGVTGNWIPAENERLHPAAGLDLIKGSDIELPYSEFGDASIGDFTSWAKKSTNGKDVYAGWAEQTGTRTDSGMDMSYF